MHRHLRLIHHDHHIITALGKLPPWKLQPRSAYTTVGVSPSEQVRVACGSNGHITLSIYHPHPADRAAPILLYIPRGPILSGPRCDEDILGLLSSVSKCTIVRINYRLDAKHRYPAPIHDVLTGYDWVTNHLAPWTRRRGGQTTGQARLGVCGELLGGSLATMLALTECRMGQTRVVAAAVNNAVLDWVFPTQSAQQTTQEESHSVESRAERHKRKRKPIANSWFDFADNGELSAGSLVELRDACFTKRSAYLDPFASPILFFRTAGADMPQEPPENRDEDILEPLAPGINPGDQAGPTMKRKAHRVFPPVGSGLQLPSMRVSAGSESVLQNQGQELVKLMRRSFVKHRDQRAENARDDEHVLSSQEEDAADVPGDVAVEAERKISGVLNPSSGLWCSPSSTTWQSDITNVGYWFRDVLG